MISQLKIGTAARADFEIAHVFSVNESEMPDYIINCNSNICLHGVNFKSMLRSFYPKYFFGQQLPDTLVIVLVQYDKAQIW